MTKKLKTGALISGGGSNLQAIIDCCQSEKISAEIVFVGADNPDAKGLQRAEKASIPTFVTDYSEIIAAYKNNPDGILLPDDIDLAEIISKQTLFSVQADPIKVKNFFKTRIAAEVDLIEKMKPYEFDLLLLAGFMRTFTPYFIDKINNNKALPAIMNIHPALLPSFPGIDGYKDTFDYGCKVGGCTVHFIDYGEDTGPIVGQKAFTIEAGDDIDAVKKRGLALEWQLFPECIELFATDRLKIKKINGRSIVQVI